MLKPISENALNQIFDILVELNETKESERNSFIDYFSGKSGEIFHEYRISGKLNPGCKFKYWNNQEIYIDYYYEHDNSFKQSLKDQINEKLKQIDLTC